MTKYCWTHHLWKFDRNYSKSLMKQFETPINVSMTICPINIQKVWLLYEIRDSLQILLCTICVYQWRLSKGLEPVWAPTSILFILFLQGMCCREREVTKYNTHEDRTTRNKEYKFDGFTQKERTNLQQTQIIAKYQYFDPLLPL